MTEPVSGQNEYYLPENNTNTQTKQLTDPDLFLKILVAQMQNQDPMNPQDSTTFINQLSQMATMEQMYNVSQSMDNMSSMYEAANYYDLIGKQVSLISEDSEDVVTGQVGGVIFYEEEPYFYLENDPTGPLYSLNQISEVTMQKDNTYNDLLSNLFLVDQIVTVESEDEDITGIVEKVLFQNGSVAIQVDGQTYGLDQLLEVQGTISEISSDQGLSEVNED